MKKAQVASLVIATLLFLSQPAAASTAYGSTNNFDCVNDTGEEAHGFDIELEDIRCTDITYTYDWNHYGVPKITEDLTDPAHPKVLVRYAAVKNADGTWSAYTAIPSGPIAPTQGHQFTDPSVNFGGEHFGVGFYKAPSSIKYNWLLDDGLGNLKQGPPVSVSTPTFTYVPPAPAAPPQVIAEIVPPPEPQVLQFGKASWVKAIKTTTHNPKKVRLRDLVGDDPGKPQPWSNGEPAEVEKEWAVLQTEFAAQNGGANGELKGAPEDLPGGDEVITRRYEFYKYIGPCDAETGEAMATAVAADGKHGVGKVTYADYFDVNTGEWHIVTTDLSKIVVVGDFSGAQMSGFDVVPALGLIDHIQDGEVGVPYVDRNVVVPGSTPWVAEISSGALPDGLNLDVTPGVLSGTPTKAGTFTFEVTASDLDGTIVTNSYTVTIAGNGGATYTISTSASPVEGGITSGGGVYNNNDSVTIVATASPGYKFVGWTHDGAHFAQTASFTFLATMNLNLVANFALESRLVVRSTAGLVGSTVTLAANLQIDSTTRIQGRTLHFSIDGTEVGTATTVASGWAYYPYTIPAGSVSGSKHAISVAFTDDTDPLFAPSVGSATLRIDQSRTNVIVRDASALAGQTIHLAGNLQVGNAARLPGKLLHFTVDGTEVGVATTQANGWAFLPYTVPVDAVNGSVHNVTVAFTDASDPLYRTSSGTATLTIDKSTTRIFVQNAAVSANGTVRLAGKLQIDNMTRVSGRTLHFSIDGTEIGTATTLDSGWAYLRYKTTGVALGEHILTVSFTDGSDPYYKTSSGTGSLTLNP